MARKPYAYTELSNIRCSSCGKRLKKNLLAKKPKAQLCYICYRALKSTRQEGRYGR